MKGIYLIAIAFLASWTVITAEKSALEDISVLEAENECPARDTCPPKLIFHEELCTKYYECNNGQKILRECASGLHFSKAWGGCVNPSNSECRDKEINDCTVDGVLLKHECDCHKFYECKNNRKVLRICPSGEHFSNRLRYCIKGNTCNDDDLANSECVEGRNVPHECKCNKYYLCKNGRKVLQECKDGWNFDNVTLTCLQGPCKPGDGCEENARKPHECLCEIYYTCVANEWINSVCQNGFHFSKTELRCMHPVDARCDINPGSCKNPANERWPHECDCRLYYKCNAEGKKEVLSCSWGRYFDKYKLECDYAENVKSFCRNTWDDDWLTQ